MHFADWLVFLGVRTFTKLFAWLGPGMGYGVVRVAGCLWYTLFRRRRLIIRRNLQIAFGDTMSAAERRRIGLLCCQHALATIADIAVRDRLVTKETWRQFISSDASLEAALATENPRGVAILSGHLGSWEMGQYYWGLRDAPVSPVMRSLDNPYLDRESTRRRTRFGGTVIRKRGALLQIREVLRNGGRVAIPADQSGPPDGMVTSFFGYPTHVHSSYARILLRQGCDLFFCVCVRDKGLSFRFQLVTQKLSVPSKGDLDERSLALVRSYHEALELVIRRYPEQYLWMHRKWRHQPEGFPSAYESLEKSFVEHCTDAKSPQGAVPRT